MENGNTVSTAERVDIFDVLYDSKKLAQKAARAKVMADLAEVRELFKEMVDDQRLWRNVCTLGPGERNEKKIMLRDLALGTVQDVEQFTIDLDQLYTPSEWSFYHKDELTRFLSDVRVLLKPGLSASAVVLALKNIIDWIEREPKTLNPRPKPCPTCGHYEDEGPF